MKHTIVAWDEMVQISMLADERDFLLKVITTYSYKDIVEWGSGGSTVLIAENKPENVIFTSIEHNINWYSKIKEFIIGIPNVNYCHIPPLNYESSPITYGAYAEDSFNPSLLEKYIHTPIDIRSVDLFLIDCVARNAILKRVAKESKKSALVLIHDVDNIHPQYRNSLLNFELIDKVASLGLFHPR
jgi:hypothetical protein